MSCRAWFLVPAVAVGLFAGCAAEQGPEPGASMFSGSPTGPGARPMPGHGHGPMMGAGAGAGMGGDASRMCATYRELTAGKPAVEGEAAVHAHMQAMHGGTLTPEQLTARRQEMERRCSAATERR